MPEPAAATTPPDRVRRRAFGPIARSGEPARRARSAAVLLLGALAGLPPASAAQSSDSSPASAIATIVDGAAHVVRDATRNPLGEGARLRADDIVDVAAGAWARMEFAGGAIVDAGPGTQLMVAPRAVSAHGARTALAYVLRGSAKLSVSGGAAGIVTPHVEVSETAGTAVCTVSAAATELFAESGPARGRDRVANAAFALAPGEFLNRPAHGKPATAKRPSADFLDALPRPFRDTIPAHAARFAGRDVPLRPGAAVSYSDVEGWMRAEPALRRGFVARWRVRLADPSFRAAVQSGLRLHPEWGPALEPPPNSGGSRSGG